jgi:APA family basic amino acid/polyamine antiporter
VGVAVALLAALVDLREAIGFSSFTVLVYYAIANAAAWTLSSRARTRIVPAVGLAGCLVLAFSLPVGSVLSGTVVLLIGVVIRAVRQRLGQQRLGR